MIGDPLAYLRERGWWKKKVEAKVASSIKALLYTLQLDKKNRLSSCHKNHILEEKINLCVKHPTVGLSFCFFPFEIAFISLRSGRTLIEFY